MTDSFNRREFLRKAGRAGISTAGLGLVGDGIFQTLEEAEAASNPTMGIASGGSPESMTKKAIDAVGGIRRFVKKGDKVVIKPNLAWERKPEEAGNTNPHVLRALIMLCKDAGASRITVVEHTCDNSQRAFEVSGAKKAVEGTGARLIAADNESMYKKVNIPRGKVLKSDTCAREILDADVFINVPIAKDHGGAGITAAMKNMMGAIWDRQTWHRSGLDQCIADYSTFAKPNLVVLDAVRVLLTKGPKGPGDTKDVNQVIACTDSVAIDTYAAKILGRDPGSVKYIAYASALGLGQMDLRKVKMKKV